jgi:hypothetical protein
MLGDMRSSDIQSLVMPRPSTALASMVAVTGGGTNRYRPTQRIDPTTKTMTMRPSHRRARRAKVGLVMMRRYQRHGALSVGLVTG